MLLFVTMPSMLSTHNMLNVIIILTVLIMQAMMTMLIAEYVDYAADDADYGQLKAGMNVQYHSPSALADLHFPWFGQPKAGQLIAAGPFTGLSIF